MLREGKSFVDWIFEGGEVDGFAGRGGGFAVLLGRGGFSKGVDLSPFWSTGVVSLRSESPHEELRPSLSLDGSNERLTAPVEEARFCGNIGAPPPLFSRFCSNFSYTALVCFRSSELEVDSVLVVFSFGVVGVDWDLCGALSSFFLSSSWISLMRFETLLPLLPEEEESVVTGDDRGEFSTWRDFLGSVRVARGGVSSFCGAFGWLFGGGGSSCLWSSGVCCAGVCSCDSSCRSASNRALRRANASFNSSIAAMKERCLR
mmetsp:Transcript_11533/g.43257  ORF Transcript_11533/g.43257 Transcript_11533/m.43257 type:complete len:260 (-) Transcript_11533:168-947(-)